MTLLNLVLALPAFGFFALLFGVRRKTLLVLRASPASAVNWSLTD